MMNSLVDLNENFAKSTFIWLDFNDNQDIFIANIFFSGQAYSIIKIALN